MRKLLIAILLFLNSYGNSNNSLTSRVNQLDSLKTTQDLCSLGSQCVSIAQLIKQYSKGENTAAKINILTEQVRNALPNAKTKMTEDVYTRINDFLKGCDKNMSNEDLRYGNPQSVNLILEIFKFQAKYIKERLCNK